MNIQNTNIKFYNAKKNSEGGSNIQHSALAFQSAAPSEICEASVPSTIVLANQIYLPKSDEIKTLAAKELYGISEDSDGIEFLPAVILDEIKLTPEKRYALDKTLDPVLIVPNREIRLNKLRLEEGKTYILGRNRQGDIFIDDSSVSNEHVKIVYTDGYYIVQDLNSLNGTKIAPSYKIVNPDELCRTKGNNGQPVSDVYIKNNELAREVFLRGILTHKSTDSFQGYLETLNQAHKMACCGSGLYYTSDAKLLKYEELQPGVQRKFDKLRNTRIDEATEVEKIAKNYGDEYRVARDIQRVRLSGISKYALPYDVNIYGLYSHTYPDGRYMDEYNYRLYETHCEIIEEIENYKNGTVSPETLLKKIAQHYQYGANARPYEHINNSLFMNEVNTYLQLAGMPKMTQGEYLDHAAQRLQPKNFANYFIDYYLENQIV